MDNRLIARWRLHAMRLAGEPAAAAAAVVGDLLAVQAENHGQASWAVACRTAGLSALEFRQQFDTGAMLRTHVLRPTWHYVHPDDIRWLIDLTGPRIRRLLVQQLDQLRLDDALLDQAAEVVVGGLSGGEHLTRGQLGERLADSALPAAANQVGAVLYHAEVTGLVCSGAMDGKDHTYALLDERAPRARRLERDEALVELVVRYFRSHGPATERDLSYWASMTLTDIRRGLADAGDRVACFEHEGRTWWHDPTQSPPDTDAPPATRGHLLQILDEYHHGVQDTRHVLDVDSIVPVGRLANTGMALVDAQMVGGMKRTLRSDSVSFDLNVFRTLEAHEVAALERVAERYGEFLGVEPVLTTSG